MSPLCLESQGCYTSFLICTVLNLVILIILSTRARAHTHTHTHTHTRGRAHTGTVTHDSHTRVHYTQFTILTSPDDGLETADGKQAVREAEYGSFVLEIEMIEVEFERVQRGFLWNLRRHYQHWRQNNPQPSLC